MPVVPAAVLLTLNLIILSNEAGSQKLTLKYKNTKRILDFKALTVTEMTAVNEKCASRQFSLFQVCF